MEIYVKNTLSLPVTNENGSYEIRLESIGGLGANLCGKMLGELGALSLSLNSLSFSSKEAVEEIERMKAEVLRIQGSAECPKCGAKMPEGAVYCSNCGTKMDDMYEEE